MLYCKHIIQHPMFQLSLNSNRHHRRCYGLIGAISFGGISNRLLTDRKTSDLLQLWAAARSDQSKPPPSNGWTLGKQIDEKELSNRYCDRY